jgi:hypothetical protein
MKTTKNLSVMVFRLILEADVAAEANLFGFTCICITISHKGMVINMMIMMIIIIRRRKIRMILTKRIQ